MTICTANRIFLLSLGFMAAALTACGQAPSGPASGVAVSSKSTQAGISKYTLLENKTTDVLQEQGADGAVLGTWERNRYTGAATQTWTDSDRNVWALSSATGCLSQNGTCIGSTEPAIKASGVSVTNQGLAVQAARSVAAQTDLNRHLNMTNPFDSPLSGSRPVALEAAGTCVAVFDIFCSTSIECVAMGGTFDCGLFATRCCF